MVNQILIPDEVIRDKILLIRGQKVMLDRDLAVLYQVETRRLNEQVKRNEKRFPADFMFQLTKDEFENWRSQFATSNSDKMGLRRIPYAFTENGVAMLSSVLTSDRAIEINIQIMRTFTRLRTIIEAHKDLKEALDQMERKYDQQFKVVFEAIRHIINPDIRSTKKIGFIKDT